MTIVFVSICQIIYTIIAFIYDDEIAQGDLIQNVVALFVGFILGSNQFLYEMLVPLKLAKEITEKKVKAGQALGIADNTVAYAGTVIGATLGFSYLMNTILFANVTFIIDRIVSQSTTVACIFLCLLLLASIVFLYRPLKREIFRVKCVRKCLKLD